MLNLASTRRNRLVERECKKFELREAAWRRRHLERR